VGSLWGLVQCGNIPRIELSLWCGEGVALSEWLPGRVLCKRHKKQCTSSMAHASTTLCQQPAEGAAGQICVHYCPALSGLNDD
jgi:hypothetical protein